MEPPMVSSSLLMRGARLGRYELIDHLATGGMAELFLARTVGEGGFEKVVVLKRILPQLAQNADFVRMFLDEARLAALLHHPNIAQVFDIGQVAGSFFFVMEHVHGRDLRDVVKAARAEGGIPLPHALSIVAAAAAGLHYAHEKHGPDERALHLVHRDVSPANLIVTFDGGVKLVDFGVAKARSQHAETRGGTLKGKISYMSPEQCRGEPVDRRSDVFALGIVLYELTTGARLFRGDNEFALLQQIANEDVAPPSLRRPDYPLGLEAIVMRALARDRSRRYRTAEDLQVDLEEFAVDHKLKSSTIGLRRWMRALFPDAVPPPVQISEITRRPTAVLLPAGEPAVKVTAPVQPPPAQTGRHAEGTPVRDPRPTIQARGKATGSNPARELPLRPPPEPVPEPKPLTKEEAVAKMPPWLAAELFPAPPVEPAPLPPPKVPETPVPVAVRAAETRPLMPHRAPAPAARHSQARRTIRRLVGAAGILALGTAALAFALALRKQSSAPSAPATATIPAPAPAPALAPAPATVPAPTPTPTPTPPGHAGEDAVAMFGSDLPEVTAILAAVVAAPPPVDEPRKRRKSTRTKKSGFWDPDSPFLPREKK
jgi:serine/threonine protein kinase